MSAAPTSPAPSPGRRPFGIVRLTAPVPAVPTDRAPAAVPAPARWHGPGVPLPPLSIAALRSPRPRS
ncbi:hypothetical protein BLA24_28760 [Streptomyces cinnamoneus]|uniref:Uncharacterized protein n=1 Tax=Streptomyces cinnamoneus TaxID=53446 RepID=A0A2G1XBV7_STRCJ|nr:hypothetical protein [Streptomyces cinnamoneus]PHQ48698.1 hypothetical protein BLA24_28760 [Streptomyces cinnamoneus]PPT12621.1 hypothetical protein CYQ11_06705 [Streptomyces cinnamoneus]